MERRDFLRSLVGGIAVAGAVRQWPFRVFSFPSEVVPANIFYDDPVYALQLEVVRNEIPTLWEGSVKFFNLIKKRSPVAVSSRGYHLPITVEP
jgi:hypothetical protein